MRKSKHLLTATMCCTMLFAAGCSKEETTDYSKYVELGEYKGIEVTVGSTEVTDDEVTAEINATLEGDTQDVEVTDRAVEDGDVVNIDYVGTVDGEEFDGGSAEAYDLTIGSGSFIDDFEEQLIGSNIGDTVEVNVTFPDEYSNNEDLAGKDAVFTVTINSITEEVVPELTDEWVTEYTAEDETPYTTVADYTAAVRAELEAAKAEEVATNKTADVLTTIIDNSTISGYPEDEIEAYVTSMKEYYESYATAWGYDLESFLSGMFGMTTEEFEEEANTLAEATIGRQMVCKLIAEAEGMTVSDEEYQTALEQYAADYSTDSVTYTTESFEEEYGKDVIEENILLEKVLDFITENAVEVQGTETTAE